MTSAVTWQAFAVTVIGSVLMASVTAGPYDYPQTTTTTTTTTTRPTTTTRTSTTTTTTTTTPTRTSTTPGLKCSGQADIVLILDASASIGSTNYDLTKQFLSNVVDQFTVGPTAIRFSAIVFSSTTSLEFPLNRYTTSADVKQAILALPYESSLTYTGKALKLAREEAFSALNGARSGVPKLAVVLTDGASSDASDTSSEAALLKASGVTVLVVGVGSGVNTAELNIIASSPSLVSTVTSFVVLEAIKSQLVQIACEEKQKLENQTTCIASSCVGKPDGNYPACDPECRQGYYYTCSNEYAHKMPCGLGWYVAPNGNRFTARMVFNPSTNTCELKSKTCPRDPYEYVVVPANQTGTSQSGNKSCISPTNTCRGKPNGNYPLCYPECQGGYYISCSNGEAIQMPCALGWYVDNQNNRFTAKMVYNPSTDTCELTSSYCPRATPNNPGSSSHVTVSPTPDTVGQCDAQADIMLCLDSSGSIGQLNYNIMADFAASLTSNFQVGPNKVRFAAVLFSSSVSSRFNFSTYQTNAEVFQDLTSIPYLSGSTNTAAALTYARTTVFPTARPNVGRVAVVVTDGFSDNSVATALEADKLKQLGVTVLAVAVGSFVSQTELLAIASSPALVYNVSSFTGLMDIKNQLTKDVCKAGNNTSSCVSNSCAGKPNGNYPACNPECKQGFYYSCSNGLAYRMPCGLGWYVRSDGSRFTAPMVYNPKTDSCQLRANYCPRDPADYVTSSGYTSARTTPGPIKSCISNNCKGKPDGNYPACQPECQEGYYYSCVNQFAYKMPCALGWYLDSRNQWYTAKMVYNPATDSCELTSASCPRYVTETTTAVVCTGGKADALFILDSSGSITAPNWQLILGFAANITKQFTVGANDVLFSAISFSNSAVREFSFTTHLTKSALEQGLLGLNYLGGGTDTADALRVARTYSLTSANGARSNVQKVAIVITDGLSNNPSATATEASSLKLTGATVIAIGVGSNVGVSELQSMASSSNLVLQVNDFNALATIKDVLVKSVCQS